MALEAKQALHSASPPPLEVLVLNLATLGVLVVHLSVSRHRIQEDLVRQLQEGLELIHSSREGREGSVLRALLAVNKSSPPLLDSSKLIRGDLDRRTREGSVRPQLVALDRLHLEVLGG